MATFTDLTRNLKKNFSAFRKIRLAIAADSATQLLARAIRGAGYAHRLDIEVIEADYDQIDRSFLNEDSPFHSVGPDIAVVYQSVERLLTQFQRTGQDERASFADRHLAHVRCLLEAFRSRCPGRFVYLNFPELDDGVFGSYANSIPTSWLRQLRAINLGLMDLAQAEPSLLVLDVSTRAARHGLTAASDRVLALTSNQMFSLDFVAVVAEGLLDVVAASVGQFKKCLVLDLDNTLWGGIVGDDGMHNLEIGQLGLGAAFSELQAWAKELKARGVILAVSSKNDPQIASEVFNKHPDMVLRMEDIAVFSVNWQNKVDNIRHIQQILEVSFDAMVFVDDNPVERSLVRGALPDVTVPELPEDPALYLSYLRSLNLFETVSVTGEDALRTIQYQQEGKRRAVQATFADEAKFLASLDMRGTVEPFTEFNVPRVAQLTQRSNQFNLRTVRYSEDEVRHFGMSPEHVALAFGLEDRFGSYGLVSVVIMKLMGDAAFIDTWIMSCRVLKRTLEDFVLNALVAEAHRRRIFALLGEYLPTKKNALVKHHYERLGFVPAKDAGGWVLDIATHRPRITHIRETVIK